MIIIGYSGHAYVIVDALNSRNIEPFGYMDCNAKPSNPYDIDYLGDDRDPALMKYLDVANWIIAVGDNVTRREIFERITAQKGVVPGIVTHASSYVASNVEIGAGTFVAANATINPLALIGKCVICNTCSLVEHDCIVGDYSHIGPGAILLGSVSIGSSCMIGAGAVVRQGITIGHGAIIGAGSVVVSDVPAGATVMGNPSKVKMI